MGDHKDNKQHLYDHLRSQQLPPLTPEQVSEYEESTDQLQKQATLNIGMIGHVAHGKSSFVRAVSGVETSRHSQEKIRNRTLQLGYANFKLFRCNNLFCLPPECYQSHPSTITNPTCKVCGTDMALLRHVSFVDCPGHEMLMRTMLNGTAVMDAAILVVAANEQCPQPQTMEHLVATEIMGLHNIIVAQNKVDLVSPERAQESKVEITKLLQHTSAAQNSPIIPICCAPKLTANIDVLLQYIYNKVPPPKRDLSSPAHMKIIRSFDVNRPGATGNDLLGGVCGGSLERGILRVGEIVEIRPGIITAAPEGGKYYQPIVTRVTALLSEKRTLQAALPGGLIAVGTLLDPVLTAANKLVGQVLGRLDTLPEVYCSLILSYKLLKKIVGDATAQKVAKIKVGEDLLLTVGSASVAGRVVKTHEGTQMKVKLNSLVCATIGEKVSFSRKSSARWRLIGCATVTSGTPAIRSPHADLQRGETC